MNAYMSIAEKFVLATQCLNKALELDSNHPELKKRAESLAAAIADARSTLPSKIVEVLDGAVPKTQ